MHKAHNPLRSETMTGASQEDIVCESLPLCLTHPFQQSTLRYGNLVRKFGSDGELVFMEGIEPTEHIEIFLRIHPDKRSENQGYDPRDLPSATSYSFAMTLDKLSDTQRNKTFVSILVNGVTDTDIQQWMDWLEFLFQNRTAYQVYICPQGNVASYNCMMKVARQRLQSDPKKSADTILYFLEDDYLHLPSSTSELIQIFLSHDPCLAVPYDYADRYIMPSDINIDDGKISVIAGRHRHWRTVSSVTVTFATRVDAFLYFNDILPHPLNDYNNSVEITKRNGTILSPIPSLSSHIENFHYFDHRTQFVSLYHNWHKMGQDLLKSNIYSSLWHESFLRPVSVPHTLTQSLYSMSAANTANPRVDEHLIYKINPPGITTLHQQVD
eukprot:gene5352-10701_t